MKVNVSPPARVPHMRAEMKIFHVFAFVKYYLWVLSFNWCKLLFFLLFWFLFLSCEVFNSGVFFSPGNISLSNSIIHVPTMPYARYWSSASQSYGPSWCSAGEPPFVYFVFSIPGILKYPVTSECFPFGCHPSLPMYFTSAEVFKVQCTVWWKKLAIVNFPSFFSIW